MTVIAEEGMELVLQLGIMTGMQFSAPSCVAESFIDGKISV